ncbi:hypothetical protein AB0M36_02245 [Actinoplanes sp. NPDC051346]|uniref:hypothetical protein n=1 Tax=Actinoplanes sp. NPDC051346 TaxID=3155048 RepID=UPI00342D0E8B
MGNVDKGAATEPQPDDGANEVYSSAVSRRTRLRRQAMIGGAGLLAVLGVGGLVAHQVLDDRDTAPAAQTGAEEPTVPGAAPATSGVVPQAAPSTGARASSAAAPPKSPAAKTTTHSKADAERIAAVRSAAAKASASAQIRRPVPNAAAANVDASAVTSTTVRQGGEALRIKSARQDLTGYRELGWIADEGVQVGNSRCTQRIRLSTNTAARERPTLLICWRTSAQKSVYTVAVKTDGRPSKELSVAEIDKQWAKLG